MASLKWRAEPGKHINNDTRERKSWNPAGKSLDLELNEERKSLQHGILGRAFRLRSNSRREVVTVGCYKLIF